MESIEEGIVGRETVSTSHSITITELAVLRILSFVPVHDLSTVTNPDPNPTSKCKKNSSYEIFLDLRIN